MIVFGLIGSNVQSLTFGIPVTTSYIAPVSVWDGPDENNFIIEAPNPTFLMTRKHILLRNTSSIPGGWFNMTDTFKMAYTLSLLAVGQFKPGASWTDESHEAIASGYL